MDKVYLVILRYNDDFEEEEEIEVYKNEEDAQKAIKEMIQTELERSWVADYEEDEFDSYDIDEYSLSAHLDERHEEIYMISKNLR